MAVESIKVLTEGVTTSGQLDPKSLVDGVHSAYRLAAMLRELLQYLAGEALVRIESAGGRVELIDGRIAVAGLPDFYAGYAEMWEAEMAAILGLPAFQNSDRPAIPAV